jgi:biopolymer transport protein ExbD
MNRLSRKQTLMAEINITPFTDVILVLLIIFMIVTPLISQSDLKVNPLKARRTKAPVAGDVHKVDVNINQDGVIFLEKEAVTQEELSERIAETFKKNPELHILLRADQTTQYRYIAKVLDILSDLDIKNINVAVETEK